MKVHELINALEKIENKNLIVCLADWNGFAPPSRISECHSTNGRHLGPGGGTLTMGNFVRLDSPKQ